MNKPMCDLKIRPPDKTANATILIEMQRWVYQQYKNFTHNRFRGHSHYRAKDY